MYEILAFTSNKVQKNNNIKRTGKQFFSHSAITQKIFCRPDLLKQVYGTRLLQKIEEYLL